MPCSGIKFNSRLGIPMVTAAVKCPQWGCPYQLGALNFRHRKRETVQGGRVALSRERKPAGRADECGRSGFPGGAVATHLAGMEGIDQLWIFWIRSIRPATIATTAAKKLRRAPIFAAA